MRNMLENGLRIKYLPWTWLLMHTIYMRETAQLFADSFDFSGILGDVVVSDPPLTSFHRP